MSGWQALVRARSDERTPRQPAPWQHADMLGSLLRLIFYRFLGARVMLALAVFGWLRRVLGGRRNSRGTGSG
jgi:hypothetical protein